MESYELCLAVIEEVSRNEHLSFATTIQQLNKACSKLKSGVKCTEDHMKRCTSRVRFAVFEEVVTGTRKVIDRICQPGSVQDDYLKFAVCYRLVMKKYINREVECKYWMDLLQNIQSKPANMSKSTEEQQKELRTFCCAYDKSLKCQVDLIKYHCEAEALEFFNIHSNVITQKLIEEHCLPVNMNNSQSCKFNPIQTNYLTYKTKTQSNNCYLFTANKYHLVYIFIYLILNIFIPNLKKQHFDFLSNCNL